MQCLGTWGGAAGGYWWIAPLVGLAFMALMAFVCFRGFGCMGGRRRTSAELSDLWHARVCCEGDVDAATPSPWISESSAPKASSLTRGS